MQHYLAEPQQALGLPKQWLVRMHSHESAVLQVCSTGYTAFHLCMKLAFAWVAGVEKHAI